MNCREFENDLYEYLEGSLGAGTQAAAEKHLKECLLCHEKVQAERQVARSLSEGFQRATERLELPAAVGRRVMAVVAQERAAREQQRSAGSFWRRVAWPGVWGAAASAVVAGWLVLLWPGGLGTTRPRPRLAHGPVSVQLSLVTPIYTFRQEDGFVIDALTCQTNVVNQRLQTELASLH
jgi:anti-sigma factor RsiW